MLAYEDQCSPANPRLQWYADMEEVTHTLDTRAGRIK